MEIRSYGPGQVFPLGIHVRVFRGHTGHNMPGAQSVRQAPTRGPTTLVIAQLHIPTERNVRGRIIAKVRVCGNDSRKAMSCVYRRNSIHSTSQLRTFPPPENSSIFFNEIEAIFGRKIE